MPLADLCEVRLDSNFDPPSVALSPRPKVRFALSVRFGSNDSRTRPQVFLHSSGGRRSLLEGVVLADPFQEIGILVDPDELEVLARHGQ